MIKDFGIKIVMDEEKIIREDKYILKEVYNRIDDIADFAAMKKIDKFNYISKNDSPSDLGCFALTNLSEHKWFMDNVKEFIWLDKEDGCHDIIKFLEDKKKKNEKIPSTVISISQDKKPQGRPKKFKDPLVANVKIAFTQDQIDLIDERMEELGFTVRLDYLRSLLKKDISKF